MRHPTDPKDSRRVFGSVNSGAEQRRYRCPRCGLAALDFAVRDGLVLVHCLGCGAGLDELQAVTGIPKVRLLTWPPPDELGPPVGRSAGRSGVREAPPTEGAVAGWTEHRRAGLRARRVRCYLAEGRGLTAATLDWGEVGYGSYHDRPLAVMFPVRDVAGQIVGVKERYWPKLWRPRGATEPVKSRTLAGEGNSWLYPTRALATDPDKLVVCEGEFDALLLNQHGIRAVTSTAGTTWKDEWNRHVAGRTVAVLYDTGSYEIAAARAEAFVAAGAQDAWPVDLGLMGLSKGEDVTDWLVSYRLKVERLREFINFNRRWYRRYGTRS